jgi:hypothetical protein
MFKYNQITQLISELLYKHDCVIVPNLGGFVAQHYASHFSSGSSLLLPPTKQILFNKNLKHNDGLLVSAYADKFLLDYNDAVSQIEDYKAYVVSLLEVKKRFELAQLGLLYIDSDLEMRFEAKVDVNFLIDSFGFEAVIANEVEQISEPRILKTTFEDRKAIPFQNPSKKHSIKKVALLAIGIPLTMALLVFGANSKPLQPIVQSSLNPFHSVEKTYVPNSISNPQSFYLDKIEVTPLVSDNNGNANFRLSEEGPVLVAKIDKVEVVNSTVNLAESNSSIQIDATYQVVVGCFGVKENAERLINELHDKQIMAAISGINSNGLYVVSCGGFNEKLSANQLVSSLKKEFPNAWVMTK